MSHDFCNINRKVTFFEKKEETQILPPKINNLLDYDSSSEEEPEVEEAEELLKEPEMALTKDTEEDNRSRSRSYDKERSSRSNSREDDYHPDYSTPPGARENLPDDVDGPLPSLSRSPTPPKQEETWHPKGFVSKLIPGGFFVTPDTGERDIFVSNKIMREQVFAGDRVEYWTVKQQSMRNRKSALNCKIIRTNRQSSKR